MDFKKVLSTSILLLWLVIIFLFSNQNAITSEQVSDKVTSKTLTTVSEVTGKNLTESRKQELIVNSRFVVRKTAHFTLYFILGLLIYTTLRSYGISKNAVIYSILFCIISSIIDEFHQLFSFGRTSRLLDIFIDTSGSVISLLFVNLISYKKLKKTCFFKQKMV